MPRFIHSSDWQLGMSRYYLSPEAEARFTQDRIDAIDRIGALAKEHAAEFVVVAGDVFESNHVKPQTIKRALDAIARVPVPVLLLPGNHDALDAASVYQSHTFSNRKPENVIVLEQEQGVEPPGTSHVEIVGAPWRSKQPGADLVARLLEKLNGPAADWTRIVVAHGRVDALAPEHEQPAQIRLQGVEEAIQGGRLHYLALGDRHSVTSLGETGAVWYSGTPIATASRELDPGSVLLVDLELGSRPVVRSLSVWGDAAWRFLDESRELTGEPDVEELAEFLEGQPHKERIVVRLTLTGALTGLASSTRLEDLLAEYHDHYASLRCEQAELMVLPGELDADEVQLSGYARAAWDDLLEIAAGAGADAIKSRDAMSLLYRFALANQPETDNSRAATV